MAGSESNTSVKVGAAVVGGGGVVGAASMFGFKKEVILIILAGIVVLFVLLLLFRIILKWRAARKANPFAQTITGAVGTTPQLITEAARRAQLDDLRKNFEAGISKLRTAGKDLYTLPWYLLVGEAGSGKTEAIRRSSLPFPPGLQDMFQGTGGTVNMNWWFSNEAVILDTAGRYLFDEVQAGASSEWVEFLELLVKQRYDCPINGLILVIPADSLIRDTSDEIEKKASLIAQQLNRIQVTLNVRFPVFIVITKCDKINGFRPFFDGLRDPQAQHQILGWSNPTALDVPFDPGLVDQHLREVRKRLLERRFGLLLDPVPVESTDGRRIDEVDDLFALPDSLLRLGPRLRRYLETVFVQSGWAQPLFLRGIYFTSSMTKDGALDAQLAALLHVPVDSLPEGRSWEQDRSFFLRNLFLKKVFPERGLVTRSSDTKRSQRRRKLALLGAGFAAALALCGFTWLAAQDLNRDIRSENDYWQAVSDTLARPDSNLKFLDLSPGQNTMYRNRSNEPILLGDDPTTVGQFYNVAWQHVQRPISVPWALRPASWLVDRSHTLASRRSEDWRLLYVSQVLRPLLDAANTKLEDEKSGEWPPAAAHALAQTLRFEVVCNENAIAQFRFSEVPSPTDLLGSSLANSQPSVTGMLNAGASVIGQLSASKELDLVPIIQYVLPADIDKLRKQKVLQPLQESLTWLQKQKNLWPPDSDIATITPDAGIARLIDYWSAQVNANNPRVKEIIKTRNCVANLRNSIDELTKICREIESKPPTSSKSYGDYRTKWQAAWEQRGRAEQAMEKQLAAFGWDGTTPLAESYASEIARVQSEGSNAFSAVLAEMPRLKPEAEQDSKCGKIFRQRKMLEDAAASLASSVILDIPLQNELKAIDNGPLSSYTSEDGTPVPLYKGIADVYSKLNDHLPDLSGADSKGQATSPFLINAAPVDDQQHVQSGRSEIEEAERTMPAQAFCNDLRANSSILLTRMVEPLVRYQSSILLLRGIPDSGEEFRDLVAQHLQGAFTILPAVPLTANNNDITTEPGFNPSAASDVLRIVKSQLDRANTGSQGKVVLDADKLSDRRLKIESAVDSYAHLYLGYWAKIELPKLDLAHTGILSWSDLQGRGGLPARASQINKPFEEFADKLEQAGNAISPFIPHLDENPDFTQMKSQITGARAALRHNAPPDDEFDTALGNWRALGSDPALARSKVLRLKPGKFLYYLILPPQTGAASDVDFVTSYWNDLTVGMLHLLGDSSEAQGRDMRRGLAKFKKFPLAVYDPTVGALTMNELNQLRTVLASIPTPVAEKGAGEDVDIASGGRLNNLDAINAELDRIASGALTAPQLSRLADLKQFVDALPVGENQPSMYKISVPFSPIDSRQWGNSFCQQWLRAHFTSKGVLDAASQWSDVQLDQDGGISNRITIQQDKSRNDPPEVTAREMGQVLFPGNAVTLSFFVIPSANNPDVVVPDGVHEIPMKTWQPLQWITTRNGQRISEDGRRWCIELRISRQQRVYSTWFQLEFDRGLPPISAWHALSDLCAN